MDPKDAKRPAARKPPGEGFQKMLEHGALERVKPSTPEESTYKLNLSGVDFLKLKKTAEEPPAGASETLEEPA